ncbi:MAG: cytochrome c [Pseudomonadales bacterium]|nr:cytochrome c [Pseudomonadales bacterium]
MKNLIVKPAAIAGIALLTACGGQQIDGEALAAEKGCVACHGVNGKAIAPIYPNLNGQWEKYLRKQLAAYRDGSRKNAIMSIQAQNLSDEDIAVLAAHYGN